MTKKKHPKDTEPRDPFFFLLEKGELERREEKKSGNPDCIYMTTYLVLFLVTFFRGRKNKKKCVTYAPISISIREYAKECAKESKVPLFFKGK